MRFASVYQGFDSLEDFEGAIAMLREGGGGRRHGSLDDPAPSSDSGPAGAEEA